MNKPKQPHPQSTCNHPAMFRCPHCGACTNCGQPHKKGLPCNPK